MAIGGQAHDAPIVKLATNGFLCEVAIAGLRAGEKFEIDFTLPITQDTVKAACVIVKLYTKSDRHLVEGHFQSIDEMIERKIRLFLANVPKASAK